MLSIPFAAGLVLVVADVCLVFALVFSLIQPRRFYLVRHGETLLNAQHVRQGEEGALSETGRMQAEQVGKYLAQFPIGRIISSTYPRAKETAAIINEHLKVRTVYSRLLVERRNPSEIIGKHTKDPEVIRIVDQMDNAYHADEYRFSDEENFVDLKQRARKALALFTRPGSAETVVVTHHVFLKVLIAYMLYREQLHAGDFAKLAFFNFSDNAGITVCEYHPLKMFSRTHGWEVLEYNMVPQ
ncbi:MAG: histidine phosphatase family protein [Minisyncoccia bacterium]